MPTNPQYDNRCNPSATVAAAEENHLRQPKPNPNPKLLTFILKSIIMILVISFFFLFLGIAAIAVLHLLLSGAHRRRRSREVSTEDLDGLPRFDYTGECHVMECAVCLEGFREGDTCRRLPGCRHVYHSGCVDRWLVKVANCPICRTRVRLETSSSGFGCVEDESKVLWSVRG